MGVVLSRPCRGRRDDADYHAVEVTAPVIARPDKAEAIPHAIRRDCFAIRYARARNDGILMMLEFLRARLNNQHNVIIAIRITPDAMNM